jgi:capsular exopolysaccharide synthesis family protein
MVAHPPAGGLTGADVWRVVRANLWLIIGVVIASGIAGYFANMWLLKNYARYTSTALISVRLYSELPTIDGTGHTLVSEPSPQNIELEQQTQASMLTNRFFLSRILEDSDSPIRQTSWFKGFGTHVDEAKEDLLDKLEVAPRMNQRLISVSFPCPSAVDSQTIVRTIAEQHIKDRKDKVYNLQVQKSQDLDRLISRYRVDLEGIHGRINTLANELAQYGATVDGYGSLEIELNNMIQKQQEANKDLKETTGKRDTFVKLVQADLIPKEVQQYINGGGGGGGSDGLIQQLEAELIVAKERFGENNDHYKDIQTRLQAFKDLKEESEGANRQRAITVIKAGMDSDIAVAQQNLEDITKRVADLRKATRDLAAKRTEIKQQLDQEHTVRDQLQRSQDEFDRLALFIQQNNWSTAEMAAQPDLPEKPSFPRLPITMSLAIGLGLVLSLGVAFLRELLDTTVRSPRDVAKVGQLNLLGLIPHEADDPQVAAARLPLAIYEAPHSIIAEQFRQVRTRLQHSASLDTVRSLLVTSTSPGDGKTVVACNLAAGLALNGRRILLVDANFRKPQIHAIFGLPNENGFGDVLNSPDLFDDAVRDTEVPNLSVITAGKKPSNPTELLESQLLIDFVERALEEYDHVIFDSGPLLIVSETAALAPRVDGVVTVVRARGNSRGLLQRMRDQLRQLKAEHMGVILNAVRSQSGGYYAPMIKTYYAYQNS